jgi:hypothetical protein
MFLGFENFPLFFDLFFWVGIGIFAAAKMAHLSDDETVAKMGHPMGGGAQMWATAKSKAKKSPPKRAKEWLLLCVVIDQH